MKLIGRIGIIFDRILGIFAIVSAVLLLLMMLLVGGEVAVRYFTGNAPLWSLEVSEYSLVFITFLGTAWLLREEGHISMDLVLNRLKPRNVALLNAATSLFGALICLIIAWYGTKATLEYYTIHHFLNTALRPPTYIMMAPIPLGSLLLFIQFVRRSRRYLKSLPAASKYQPTGQPS